MIREPSQEQTALIRAENLTKEYRSQTGAGNARVLDRLNLTVYKGECFAFIGPNGAGKTTTIKLLLGFIFPTSGKVWVMGEPAGSVRTRVKIGYISESSDFYRYLRAEELLNFYGRLFGMKKEMMAKRAEEVLSLVGLLNFKKMPVRFFSKGMLQRLNLAQALLNDPELLILDEPTSGLDPLGRRDIRDVIQRLRREGKTIFFSSHELSEVELIADRIGVIDRGMIVESGRLEDLIGTEGNRQGSLEDAFIRLVRREV